jgi:hypothetical protein
VYLAEQGVAGFEGIAKESDRLEKVVGGTAPRR